MYSLTDVDRIRSTKIKLNEYCSMHVRNKKCVKVWVRRPAGKGPLVRHVCRWMIKSQDILREHKGGVALLILNLTTRWEWSNL